MTTKRSTALPHRLDGRWVVAVMDEKKGKPKARAVKGRTSPEVEAHVLRDLGEGGELAGSPSLTDQQVRDRTIEVDYEKSGGAAPQNVRLTTQPAPAGDRRGSDEPVQVEQQAFLNPYSFVASPDRSDLPDELADGLPASHASAATGTWTGRIVADLTVVTPLLTLDEARSQGEKVDGKVHRTYGVRRDSAGRPVLPATSLKGSLRAAYEAITASRFGVWSQQWDRPLAFREDARQGAAMTPVRVEGSRDKGDFDVTRFVGRQAHGGVQGIQAAAWLPMYRNPSVTVEGRQPQHGDELWAELVLIRHASNLKRRNEPGPARWGREFHLWRVGRMAETEDGLDTTRWVEPSTEPGAKSWYQRVEGVEPIRVHGVVVVTGRSISGKHDERFAFNPTSSVLSRSVAESYNDILRSYEQAREHDADPAQGVEWGKHITDRSRATVCSGLWGFARTNGETITNLVPVHIGRRPWEKSPADLARAKGLLPPTSLDGLSPADRVFGWVSASETEAHRGQLRIHSVACAAQAESIEGLDPPVPLAVLGAPKPTQGRFYTGSSGAPHDEHSAKELLYGDEAELRGRKFYWHHAGYPERADYWDLSADPIAPREGWFQEFRSPGGTRSDQNRSIDSWIKPGTTFRVEIDVVNLSLFELGALVWLLHSDHGGALRCGYGKPLGFGTLSVELDADATQLWCHGDPGWGDEAAAVDLVHGRYRSLPTSSVPAAGCLGRSLAEFERVAPSDPRQQYRKIMAGDPGLRVHYPRVEFPGEPSPPPPDHEGKNYRWFVENERGDSKDSLPLPTGTRGNRSLGYHQGDRKR